MCHTDGSGTGNILYCQGRQEPIANSIIVGTIGKSRLIDKLIMIDPEMVVESIVVNPDNNRYSYFGRMK